MDAARKNRDFSKGPVWDARSGRWLVEVRYPDGSRLRKRFRREREALRLWSSEQTKIENGTWHEQAPKIIAFGAALEQYPGGFEDPEPVARELRRARSENVGAGVGREAIPGQSQRRPDRGRQTATSADGATDTADKDLGVLKAFFNWCIDRGLAASNPVRRVKFFHSNNERIRYLLDEEWDRLRTAAAALEGRSPSLVDKMVLARNTGLRRANLFRAHWAWVDWLNRVIRVPRTKNNLAHAVPLNDTAYVTLKRLYAGRDLELDSEYIFVHPRDARHSGKPVLDVKNAFHTALKEAAIDNFTWHDFRHDYASRLVMAGVSLRAVAELLGHRGLRMVMRYAHLSPGYLSDEVKKLDTFSLAAQGTERARKGQRPQNRRPSEAKVAKIPRKDGSSGRIRTYNPPVNSRMLYH